MGVPVLVAGGALGYASLHPCPYSGRPLRGCYVNFAAAGLIFLGIFLSGKDFYLILQNLMKLCNSPQELHFLYIIALY